MRPTAVDWRAWIKSAAEDFQNKFLVYFTSHTCMALLPSLTTSNRVTGSPPSPLCWATPLAFPRPLATPRVLSVGDFRGFLLDACVGTNPCQCQIHSEKKKDTNSHVLCTNTLVPGLVFQASLSSSSLLPLDPPSHSCSCLNPLCLLPQTHWTSPWGREKKTQNTCDSHGFSQSFHSTTQEQMNRENKGLAAVRKYNVGQSYVCLHICFWGLNTNWDFWFWYEIEPQRSLWF